MLTYQSTTMIELERRFLLKFVPKDLEKHPSKEIIDIYIPYNSKHPKIRIRKNGDKYEITKKEAVLKGEKSQMLEQNIILTEKEFNCFNNIKGKRLHKIRHFYPYKNLTAQIDIFQDDLKGLAIVDFEFSSIEEMNNFKIPKICLAEVTQYDFIAGGMLCGKKFEDIKNELEKIKILF